MMSFTVLFQLHIYFKKFPLFKNLETTNAFTKMTEEENYNYIITYKLK